MKKKIQIQLKMWNNGVHAYKQIHRNTVKF